MTEHQAVRDTPVRQSNWLERKKKNIKQPSKALTPGQIPYPVFFYSTHIRPIHTQNYLHHFNELSMEHTSTSLSFRVHLEPEPTTSTTVSTIILRPCESILLSHQGEGRKRSRLSSQVGKIARAILTLRLQIKLKFNGIIRGIRPKPSHKYIISSLIHPGRSITRKFVEKWGGEREDVCAHIDALIPTFEWELNSLLLCTQIDWPMSLSSQPSDSRLSIQPGFRCVVRRPSLRAWDKITELRRGRTLLC